jgi:hypothetical protein
MATKIGQLRGRIESINPEIKESMDKGTPFLDCICIITDEASEHKGRRVPWSAFLSEHTAVRTYQSLQYAGCKFENGEEDFSGHDAEVMLDIEEEEYTPPKSEENPEPRTSKRWRVAWVNRLVRGMAGNPMDANKRKAFGATVLKGALAAAKAGGRKAAGDDPSDGIPEVTDPKTGKKNKAF